MRLLHCLALSAFFLAAEAQDTGPGSTTAPGAFESTNQASQNEEPPRENREPPRQQEPPEANDGLEDLVLLPESVLEEAPVATRFETLLQIAEFTESEDFAAASALTDQLLTLTEEEFGADSAEFAKTLVQVATVQRQNLQHTEAEENTLLALEIYRDVAGPFAAELIEPYIVLGDNYGAAGDYAGALSSYNEARTVSRRRFGLLNLGQIEILDRMTNAADDLGQLEEAHALQKSALTLVERTHEPNSPEVIDAVFKYAYWLRQKRQFLQEREQYGRIDRIIREEFGEDSVQMVRHLRERGNSFRIEGIEHSQGISGLTRALEILEAEPESDPMTFAELLRDIGDWEVAFSRLGSYGGNYIRAWEALENVENGPMLREQWFDRTTMVLIAPLSQRDLSTDPDAPTGNVVVHFTVETTGRTSDVQIVESNPPGLKDEAVARQFRQSRFRPQIRDGELVPSRRGFDISFKYNPPEDEEEG